MNKSIANSQAHNQFPRQDDYPHRRRAIPLFSAIIALGVGTATPVTGQTIADNFDDGIKDSSIWGTDSGTTLANLQETSGSLQFSTSSLSGTITKNRPLVRLAGFSEDWQVRLDVGNSGNPPTNSGWIAVGLTIADASKPLDPPLVKFRLYASNFYGGGTVGRGFFSGGAQIGYKDTYSAGSTTSGSILVTFNKMTKVITTFYDIDGPTNGYKWSLLQRVGLAGSGGDSNVDLGMTYNSSFEIGVYGESMGNIVSPGVAWVDNFRFETAVAPLVTALPDYVHNPNDGPQAVKNFRLDPSGQCAFTFSTSNPGALCIVSWTKNFQEWFPLIHFNTTGQGTEIQDTPRDPSRFYRTSYLPSGVDAAESFCYPIGSGILAEQIDPEYPNSLFPAGPEGTVERPQLGQVIDASAWYNAQDVGSFLMTSKGPGYHPGEDWNIGGDADGDGIGDDVGRRVLAVADGVIRDISPLNNTSNGGWAIVIQHYLLDGETLESIYVHVAPPTLADHSTPNSDGLVGAESWFPLQEGMPVSKGDVIAVVGDVDAYPDHLHFEIRKKAISNLPVPAGSAAISFYWPHSMGNAYYATFTAMEREGIVDPSDFIDENQ